MAFWRLQGVRTDSKQNMVRWWSAAVNGVKRVAAKPNSRPSSSSYHTIQAIPREVTGSRVSVKDRAQGRIPAVVFSQHLNPKSDGSAIIRSVSRKHLLTTERKQIQSILKSVELPFFCSTTFQLQIHAVPGSKALLECGTVLPIKVHRVEESDTEFVFLWADNGSELKVDVPVVFKGEDACPGIQKVKLQTESRKPVVILRLMEYSRRGQLNKIQNSLKFLRPVEHIPSKIEVDVSKLDIEDRISMHEIEVHPSLKLQSRNETMPICKVRNNLQRLDGDGL
ncbi:LOW QUALITY PROTEIN: Ribosomal protein L25, beta domain, partial [Dillenia turbinata]